MLKSGRLQLNTGVCTEATVGWIDAGEQNFNKMNSDFRVNGVWNIKCE